MTMIYLDNNATTRIAGEAFEAMKPYYLEFYGNPHSAHDLGRKAHDALEEARGNVARLLGAESGTIYFTSCGTESNAIALRGLLSEESVRHKVVTTSVEHPSVLALLQELNEQGTIRLAIVPVTTDGAIDLASMRREVDDETMYVTVMLAQNETGVVHAIPEIAAIAHRHGALLHVDAVQAAGKIPIDVEKLGADLLSISGHKFHAPKGVGALYVRQGVPVSPLWRGGGQEAGLRSGTEAVPSLVALGVASSLAVEGLAGQGRVGELRDRLEQLIRDGYPEVVFNGSGQPRLPNTTLVSFRHLMAGEIIRDLNGRGVAASAGAACHSGSTKASAVMRAMKKPLDYALGTVRFSLSRFTSEKEVAEAAKIIVDVARSLRAALTTV